MFVATNEPSYAYFLLFAIVYRLPLIASVAFAIGTIATRKSLRALVPLVVLLWVGPPLAAQVIKPRVPPIFETFYAIHVPAGETWRYSVELGETFLSQFSAATRRAARVQFMFPGQHPPYDARITTAEGVILASVTDGSTMLYSAQSPADVAQALAKTRRINVEITARPEKQSPVSGVSVFGWQRRDLPRRSFVSASGRAFDAPTLPAFEMRLFDSTSRLILVGF